MHWGTVAPFTLHLQNPSAYFICSALYISWKQGTCGVDINNYIPVHIHISFPVDMCACFLAEGLNTHCTGASANQVRVPIPPSCLTLMPRFFGPFIFTTTKRRKRKRAETPLPWIKLIKSVSSNFHQLRNAWSLNAFHGVVGIREDPSSWR